MGKVTRKRHTAEFKARVVLEAIKREQTVAKIGAKHGVHVTMVAAWKNAAVVRLSTLKSRHGSKSEMPRARASNGGSRRRLRG